MYKYFVAIFLLIVCLAPKAEAIVYMKPKEALKQLFASSDVVRSDKKQVSDEDRARLSKILGYPFKADSITFFVGQTGDKIDGTVVMDEEIGKTQPISFMTLISPAGKVQAIEVLAYRESQGGEIRYPRFKKQFYGKDKSDRLEVGKDIQNISGATLSVRATAKVVKRALALWNYFYSAGRAQ